MEEVKQQIRMEAPYVTGPIGRPRKLNIKDIEEIKQLREQGWSLRKMAKQKRVSHETIRKTLRK